MINSAQIIGFLLVSGNFRTGDCENAFPGETGKEKVNHSQGDTASKNSVSDFGEDQEYFPYGETWVQNKATSEQTSTPYKFTSKELDEETGLYYYGVRSFDPKLSRWISADPPMSRGDYFPEPSIDDEAKEQNSKLPGMGGVFNSINLDAYQYAGQNPVKLIDPDGNQIIPNPLTQLKVSIEVKCDEMNQSGAKFAENHPVAYRGLYNMLGFSDGWLGISVFKNGAENPTNPYVSDKTKVMLKNSYKIGRGYGADMSNINLVVSLGKTAATKTLGKASDIIKGAVDDIKPDAIPAKIGSWFEGIGKVISSQFIKPEVNKKIEKK